jgi:hypothetical protein
MPSDCYRCGRPIEGQLAFCSACGAPQIRVSRTPENSPEDALTPESGQQPSIVLPNSRTPSELAPLLGIDWKYFLRAAAPLAVLTGMLTVVIPPLGLLIMLPASLFWSIARYRQQHAVPLRNGQGATMGAMMAILSFGVFLFFALAGIYLKSSEYREFLLARVHEAAARNPDPQNQQALQWLASPEGLIFFTVILMAMIFVIFLVIGMGSGALAVALGKNRKQY